MAGAADEDMDTRVYRGLALNTPARERVSIGWGAAEGAAASSGACDGEGPEDAGPGEVASAELTGMWPVV